MTIESDRVSQRQSVISLGIIQDTITELESN